MGSIGTTGTTGATGMIGPRVRKRLYSNTVGGDGGNGGNGISRIQIQRGKMNTDSELISKGSREQDQGVVHYG